MKPVYQEEIKAAYGGEPKGVHFHRPGKNVIEFIKPETPVANFKFNYDNYTILFISLMCGDLAGKKKIHSL